MRSWDPAVETTGDRQLVKDFVGEIRRPLYGACVFCGWPAHGRTCEQHRDLAYLDPLHIPLHSKGRAAV